ncbi:MAG: SOS response-associated peptidase [Pararhizobium sp.]
MCGRFSLTEPKEAVEEIFGPLGIAPFPPRYNIAPTQPILVVAAGSATGAGGPARLGLLACWGLWPAWMKDPRDFPLMFNARAESAAEKASFRSAIRYRRVLVPASGFYEWQRPPSGSRGKSQAYWVRPRKGAIVAFGGLMETWHAPDGSEIDTAAILTTEAPESFRAIHDRMPLVIDPHDFDRWLDCRLGNASDIDDLLRPAPPDLFEAVPISDRVNKAANLGPDLQKPVAVPEEPMETVAGEGEQGCLF